MKRPSTIAVIVTMNRPQDLDRLLTALARQTRPLSAIVVVNNGTLAETDAVVARYPVARLLHSRRNLGGAGGFVYGIMHGLALGGDLVWIMDDDGYPETDDCLADLEQAMEADGYDMVSPVIIDIDDPSKLAFYHYRNGRPLNRRDQLDDVMRFPQFAHLFNGALIRAETFERYGLPRYELFFRGDETDFMYRLKRDGARFATIAGIGFLHPSGNQDTVPIMGGRFYAVIPKSGFARYYFYRNRGNLFREFKLVRAAIYDLIRYSWAFLITLRGDRNGFLQWLMAVTAGWRRKFTPYRDPYYPPNTHGSGDHQCDVSANEDTAI